MKGRKVREYTKDNGNVVSVIELNGKPEELSAYEAHQGSNFVKSDDNGKPLFFATTQASDLVVGDTCDIIFAEKIDQYIIDNSAQRRVNKMLAKHAGTPLGDAMAAIEAQKLLDKAYGVRSSTATPETAPEESDEESAE